MSELQEIIGQLKDLEGKKIESVDIGETEDGSVYCITLTMSNGDKVDISPTNYNYGGQHLRVEVV